jgi:integrase
MKLPTFIRKNRYGIYYLRFLVTQKVRQRFDDIPKEIRVSLNTSKKREALNQACALYTDFQDLFSEGRSMVKMMFEGEEIDEQEYFIRHKQRSRALEAIKKAKRELEQQQYFNEALQKLLANETKSKELMALITKQDHKIEAAKGKYLISDVILRFVEEKTRTGAWTGKTKDDYGPILSFFREVLGDRYFDQLRYDDLNFYKERVLRIPKNWRTNPKYKDKTIEQIMAMEAVETIGNKTRKKHFDLIKSLFDWAERNGKTDKNYASGLKITIRDDDDESKEKFTKEDLQKIISSDEYMCRNGKRHKKAANFWIPLISIFTGARINELCQLKVSDIQKHESIWCISINEEEDKNVKTKAAIRKVPIHKTIIDLGFLNYVEGQKKSGADMLFSELKKHSRNGYGAGFGRWFNERYLVTCGVRDKDLTIKKTHHSFRHTLYHLFEVLSIDEKRVNSIIGHASEKKKKGTGTYGSHGLELKLLAEVIAKIDFGLDFSHLMDKSGNEYLGMN